MIKYHHAPPCFAPCNDAGAFTPKKDKTSWICVSEAANQRAVSPRPRIHWAILSRAFPVL
jgi:hypothetical protein